MAKTILIVEDDPNISELVQMYLEKEGYSTRVASDGGQGIDLFRQALVIWAHRENIRRLLHGTESRFRWHTDAP